MAETTAAEAAFVDRVGLFFETVGGPRTMGRIYGWLMICDPPHQSLGELAAALRVSKAAISTTVRLLQDAGMVERLAIATRQHHYRLVPGGFTRVLQVQLERLRAGVDAAELGLAAVGTERAEQRARLVEFRDFCEFASRDFGDEFMKRWADYRAAKESAR